MPVLVLAMTVGFMIAALMIIQDFQRDGIERDANVPAGLVVTEDPVAPFVNRNAPNRPTLLLRKRFNGLARLPIRHRGPAFVIGHCPTRKAEGEDQGGKCGGLRHDLIPSKGFTSPPLVGGPEADLKPGPCSLQVRISRMIHKEVQKNQGMRHESPAD